MVLADWGVLEEAVRAEAAEWGDPATSLRVLFRLLAAIVLGGLLGFERAHEGKPAGARTHGLVALGTALVVLVPRMMGLAGSDVSRVIQGAIAGIGFIGGGVILKQTDEGAIKGLTTAASLWVAAAVGIAVGLGQLWYAFFGAVLAFGILFGLGHLKHRWRQGPGQKPTR